MNVLFIALALISALYWISIVVLWFRYMKTIPVFEVADRSYNEVIYPSLSIIYLRVMKKNPLNRRLNN